MYIIIILQGIVCMYVCIQLIYLYRLLAHFVQLVNFRPLLTLGQCPCIMYSLGVMRWIHWGQLHSCQSPPAIYHLWLVLGYYESQVKCSNKLTPKRVDLFQHPNSWCLKCTTVMCIVMWQQHQNQVCSRQQHVLSVAQDSSCSSPPCQSFGLEPGLNEILLSTLKDGPIISLVSLLCIYIVVHGW